MAYARWYMESSREVEGASNRAHWEAAARKGNEDAIRKLHGPEFPESLDYLWNWALQLYGRSGMSMAGLLPLSYTTIAAWAELTEQWPTPREVRALIQLDGEMIATTRPEKHDG